MLKKLFNKKSEDKEEQDQPKKEASPRPKIVIKQRRPSSAPLPNGIANAMSPHSMPREEIVNRAEVRPQEEPPVSEEVEQPIQAAEPSVSPEVEAKPAIDVSPYEAEIEALRTEKSQLQEKTLVLIEEARGLHAALDSLEKSSTEEISSLKESLEAQENNYSALEDEFLQQKEDVDELQKQLSDLDEDHKALLDEFEDLQSMSVPKRDLLSIQAKLREEINRRDDFENQTIALKKDQARYETMVSELSAHITELKDSVDKGADEQMRKLMEVKDQELEMKSDRIDELEKLVKDHNKEKKQLQQLINDKESLIETYQEYEAKYIDSQEALQEQLEAFQELEISYAAAKDQLSLKTTDLENVSPKLIAFEKQVSELNSELLASTSTLTETLEKLDKAESEIEEINKEWAAERTKWQSKDASAKESQTEWKSKLQSLTVSKEKLESDLEALQVEMTETLKKLDVSNSENETFAAQLAEKDAIINASSDSSAKADEKLSELEGVIAGLQSQNDSLKEDYTSEKDNLEKEIAELRSAAEQSDESELIESLRSQLVEKESQEEEKSKVEASLRAEIEKLTDQLSTSGSSDDIEELTTLKTKYEEAIEREERLIAEISELKKNQENTENSDVDSSGDVEALASIQQKYNDSLKREESLMSDIEELQVKYSNLEAQISENNSATDESTDSTEQEKLNEELSKQVQELEAEQEALNAKVLELEAVNKQLSDQVGMQNTTDEQESEDTTYTINLVMKPDNDEYELELPGNMNGKEIKTELTDAGLLEEGRSYDLFLPNQDAYIMNDQMLSNFDIAQGEILEIIPG